MLWDKIYIGDYLHFPAVLLTENDPHGTRQARCWVDHGISLYVMQSVKFRAHLKHSASVSRSAAYQLNYLCMHSNTKCKQLQHINIQVRDKNAKIGSPNGFTAISKVPNLFGNNLRIRVDQQKKFFVSYIRIFPAGPWGERGGRENIRKINFGDGNRYSSSGSEHPKSLRPKVSVNKFSQISYKICASSDQYSCKDICDVAD